MKMKLIRKHKQGGSLMPKFQAGGNPYSFASYTTQARNTPPKFVQRGREIVEQTKRNTQSKTEARPKAKLLNKKAIDLQRHLYKTGYLKSTKDIDGIVGAKTRAAIKAHNAKNVDFYIDDDYNVYQAAVVKGRRPEKPQETKPANTATEKLVEKQAQRDYTDGPDVVRYSPYNVISGDGRCRRADGSYIEGCADARNYSYNQFYGDDVVKGHAWSWYTEGSGEPALVNGFSGRPYDDVRAKQSEEMNQALKNIVDSGAYEKQWKGSNDPQKVKYNSDIQARNKNAAGLFRDKFNVNDLNKDVVYGLDIYYPNSPYPGQAFIQGNDGRSNTHTGSAYFDTKTQQWMVFDNSGKAHVRPLSEFTDGKGSEGVRIKAIGPAYIKKGEKRGGNSSDGITESVSRFFSNLLK